MRKLKNLFDNNRRWAARTREANPEFFKILSMQQNPEYLWIGCSDSRVPANQIVDLLPGELFVHRNVANVVVHTDHNCLSVMQYAVEVLKVKHIMVVGHYGCGGVQAVLDNAKLGFIDNWLRHVGDVKEKHLTQLEQMPVQIRLSRLIELNVIELNVIEQVRNVCRTSIVQDAWTRGQALSIHGWVYGLEDGHIHDLESVVTCATEESDIYKHAIAHVLSKADSKL
jgi:carbonic anhydrase